MERRQLLCEALCPRIDRLGRKITGMLLDGRRSYGADEVELRKLICWPQLLHAEVTEEMHVLLVSMP